MFKPHVRRKRKSYAVGTTSVPSIGKAILGGLANAPLAILDQFIDRNYEVGTEALPAQESQVVEKSLDYLLNSVIPVKVQNWLKANQNTEITSLAVARTPIKQWINTALNILSAGQWNKVKSDVGYDKLYHLYIIINNKWIVEKNEVFNIKPYTRPSDEEKIEIPVNETTTIGEFFSNVKNPENFYSNYDAFKNNCQSSALYLLQVNPKVVNLTSALRTFIKQDVTSLLKNKNVETASKTVRTITNIGATMNKLLQYVSGGKLSFAHGGVIGRI
jgi:predicted DNA-binding ribbon-helix-helix protein